MKTRIFLLSIVLIIATLVIVSCYKSNNSYNSPGTMNSKVSITSSGYSPASVTISTSSTVTWTNNDNMVHTVTTADGSINSGDIAPASSYSKTFTSAGTYNYYDAHNTNMKGVLIVTGSSGGGY